MSANSHFLYSSIILVGKKVHNPTGVLSLSLSSSADLTRQFNARAAAALSLASTARIVGGRLSPVGNLGLSLSSVAAITGLLLQPVGAQALSLSSLASIAAEFNPKGFLDLSLSGIANITFGNIVFKWSTEHLEASTNYGFPTVYVDINSDAIPVGAFPEGDFYERRLLQMPRLQEVELDTRFGISGFQRVTFTVDNSDRLISGLDLQDSFVRMLFVDEDGKVYKDFKGKVVDWTLSHQVTINVEDIEALAFTQDLPKRTLNDLIETEKTSLSGSNLTEFTNSVLADDLGKPVPIIFGRAIKVPLLYVKADETNREYDYIIGEGLGLNSKYFKEVFTVYRDDLALDDTPGVATGGDTSTLNLDLSEHERPNAWYENFWIFVTSGNAIGDIKRITDHTNNTVTVEGGFSGNVNSGDTYELREWQFFDGSQTGPYSGYAFIRFNKRLGTQGRTDPLFADVNGLQDEVNVVRAVQSILTNSNWGFGLKVNTTSFDNAADLTEIAQMKCEGGILNTTSAGDLLRELLGFRDMVLTKIE